MPACRSVVASPMIILAIVMPFPVVRMGTVMMPIVMPVVALIVAFVMVLVVMIVRAMVTIVVAIAVMGWITVVMGWTTKIKINAPMTTYRRVYPQIDIHTCELMLGSRCSLIYRPGRGLCGDRGIGLNLRSYAA